MTSRHVLMAAALGVMLLATSACTVHKLREGDKPPVPVPEEFTGQGKSAPLDRWWESFDDADLSSLIERVLKQNLELKAAWGRLDQAGALAKQAGAGRLPDVNLEAGAARTRVNKPTAPGKATGNLFTVGIAASYEVDLWGRVRRTRDAALIDWQASREDLDATAVTLAATVAETWFSLIERHAQRQLLQDQTAASKTFLELTELRFGQGQASALDVYQQRQQVAATSSQIAPIEARIRVLEHLLTVLLGGDASWKTPNGERSLPGLPELPGTGVPADLLKRRPDVRAAYRRLAAADHRIAVAAADRYPALRLTAGTGYQGGKYYTIFDNWVWNIAAGLTAPLFDAGRRKAEVNRTKAAVIERLNTYGQSVLTAVQEVEDALIQERQQVIFLRDLDSRVTLAKKTLNEARSRYVNGLSDYLNVLTALTALQLIERERLTAHRQLISFRIQLHRALGGAWPRSLKPNVKMAYPPDSGEKK